jgi:hypothetical protein
VVFAAAPHVLVGPVRYGFYYLFRVVKAIPAHRKPLAQAEAAIRRKLAFRRASTELLAAFEAKWVARTRCRSGYVVAQCGRGVALGSHSSPLDLLDVRHVDVGRFAKPLLAEPTLLAALRRSFSHAHAPEAKLTTRSVLDHRRARAGQV